MNRVNNNKKSKKEIDEIDFDEVSIKSSKKVSKNSDKKGKTKKEIKQEKKRAKKEARKKGIRNFWRIIDNYIFSFINYIIKF